MVETEAILAGLYHGLGPTHVLILLKRRSKRWSCQQPGQKAASSLEPQWMAAQVTLVHPHILRAKDSHLYFTTHIQWQFRQHWVGSPVSGLLIKLITMVTGRERSHLPTPIFSHNSFKGFKSPGRQAPFQHTAGTTALPPKRLTGSGTVNRNPKATNTSWQKPPSKSSLRSWGYSILTLLLLEMFCWGCLLFMFTPSQLAKTQCHLLVMQVPRKACFGQVCSGEPGGLSRLKRQKLLKEFKPIWREFIIIVGTSKGFVFMQLECFDKCPMNNYF